MCCVLLLAFVQHLNVLIIALALTMVMTVMAGYAGAPLHAFTTATPKGRRFLVLFFFAVSELFRPTAGSYIRSLNTLLWHTSRIACGTEWNLKVDATNQLDGTLRQ